jgi:hypothetical protein
MYSWFCLATSACFAGLSIGDRFHELRWCGSIGSIYIVVPLYSLVPLPLLGVRGRLRVPLCGFQFLLLLEVHVCSHAPLMCVSIEQVCIKPTGRHWWGLFLLKSRQPSWCCDPKKRKVCCKIAKGDNELFMTKG